MKICNKCKTEKDLSEFNKCESTKDNFQCICKQCQKKYIEENKEHIKEYRKKWEKNNKEHVKEYNKKQYKKNIEKKLKQQKEHYQNNKKYINECNKTWKINNSEKCKEYNRKRRALKTNAEGNFTEKEFGKLLEIYNYKCCSCGIDLRKTAFHRDHIIPLSKGGSDYISNIQPLCEHCNCSKNSNYIDYRDNWLKNYAI